LHRFHPHFPFEFAFLAASLDPPWRAGNRSVHGGGDAAQCRRATSREPKAQPQRLKFATAARDQRHADFLKIDAANETNVSDREAAIPSSLLLGETLARPIAAAAGAALLLAIFLAAVALPLATYTTALAMFGLAHVGSELRYVDYRFGVRLRGGLVPWLVSGLAGAVAVRILGMTGLMPYGAAIVLELAIVATMTGSVVVGMRRFRAAGAAVAAVLFGCAVSAPVPTFLFLAVAHNLTPLAFFADALGGAERRRVLAVMLIPFVALPLTIATGLPHALLAQAGLVAPEVTVFSGGMLADNLGAYVPPAYLDAPWAVNVFSAAVFAQCMHYAVVIFVLPRLISGAAARRTLVPWPNAGQFFLCLAGLALALAVGFSFDYGAARKFYALAALVHGWIEIPILVLALDRGGLRTVRAG
jgi:hypothetical protein